MDNSAHARVRQRRPARACVVVADRRSGDRRCEATIGTRPDELPHNRHESSPRFTKGANHAFGKGYELLPSAAAVKNIVATNTRAKIPSRLQVSSQAAPRYIHMSAILVVGFKTDEHTKAGSR